MVDGGAIYEEPIILTGVMKYACGKTEKFARFSCFLFLRIPKVPSAGRWQMSFGPCGGICKPCKFFRFSAKHFSILFHLYSSPVVAGITLILKCVL